MQLKQIGRLEDSTTIMDLSHAGQASQTTATFERVERQFGKKFLHDDHRTRNNIFSDVPPAAGDRPILFENPLTTSRRRAYGSYSKEQAEQPAAQHESLCHKLYSDVVESKDYWSRLDSTFSQIVQCNFLELSDVGTEFDSPQKAMAEACRLLGRLPAFPLELPDLCLLPSSAFACNGSSNETVGWQDLDAVSRVDTNVIRVAIAVAMYGPRAEDTMVKVFIDRVAELLSTASRLANLAISSDEKSNWFLVRAFLWTSWQRSSMLYFYSQVCGMSGGFDDHPRGSLVLQGFFPVSGMSIQEMSRRFAGIAKPPYMCGWAFELIRADTCAVGLDFRNFFQRFSAAFADCNGRCISGQQASCKGEQPDSCQRFKGMKIENQSAHHGDCSGDCGRLTWDKTSYVSVLGARAVALDNRIIQEKLTYCRASDKTLAISHVWSHGQGGRPEVGHGLNRCLHERYTFIAQSLGCDSYWMDTPCIPEDHELRREAILKINGIFENSKATLVCDRDLMRIDATELSVNTCETILVTTLVCDWNLRAWTFLEAVRGRRNVCVLCKDQKVVSFREVVTKVQRQGSIDIALLLLATPHLLPAIRNGIVHAGYMSGAIANSGPPTVRGFMSLEAGGSRLSYREASRPGDDIVIWSLLVSDRVFNDAKAFWKGKVEHWMSASFLFSSAPRLKTRGLRWAPSSPTAELLTDRLNNSKYRLLPMNSTEQSKGEITKDGYSSHWLMYELPGGMIGSELVSSMFKVNIKPLESRCLDNLGRIRQRYLQGYLWGALLRLTTEEGYDDAVKHGNNAGRMLLAVCATNKRWNLSVRRVTMINNNRSKFVKDKRIFWTWCGIYEWDMVEPLPQFARVRNVYII